MRPSAERHPPSAAASLSVLAATLLVLAATLHPVPGDRALGWSVCLLCGARGTADAIANVALFLPLGAALCAARFGTRTSVATGAALSLVIELAQRWVPGRDPSPPDLLFNTLGVLLGHAATVRWGSYRRTRRGAWTGMAWGALLGPLAGSFAWLATPAYPAGPPVEQWTPSLRGEAPYPGRLLGARAAGGGGEDRLEVRFVLGAPPPRPAPLYRVVGRGGVEAYALHVHGSDLRVAFRDHAAALRLGATHYRFPGLLAGLAVGDTVRLSLRWGGGWAAVRTPRGGWVHARLSLARGWSILLGGSVAPGDERRVALLDLLWITAWGALPGLLLGGCRRPLPGALLCALGVLLVPPLSGLHPLSAQAAAAWLAALLVGIAGARRARAQHPPPVRARPGTARPHLAVPR